MFSKFLQIPTYPSLPFSFYQRPSNLFVSLPFRPEFPPSRHLNPHHFHHCSNGFPSRCHFCPPLASSFGNSEPLPDNQSELKEAQDAISEFIQEFGVSGEISIYIAANSPRYLGMLVDGVRDLDELSLWDSWRSDGKQFLKVDSVGLSFKEKVGYMAKEKGDNGKVAFLESVGLNLSSAMNAARYLSAETLPALIHKVQYMKEVLFSDNDNDGLLVKNAHRMMKHLSIPVDEDLQHTLSFFEKIEARRGGLNMLGSRDDSFQYLIESFPRILLLSVKCHLIPLVDFLENIGLPRDRFRNVILLFPPVLLWNIEVIEQRILAFKEIDVVERDFGKLLLKYPWILSTSIQGNYRAVLSLFDIEKVPKVSVGRAIKSWPHLLGCSTSKLKLMMKQFGELGIQNRKVGRVIAQSPQLLLLKPQEFLQVVVFFEDMGFNKETIGRILARCPETFAASIEETLKRKLDFLSAIGVSNIHLPRVIKKYPEFLVSDVDRTLLPRMTYLMKLGLSGKDIAFIVRTFPPLLGYSIEEVLRPKVEFLVQTMERPVRDVVGYPRFFSYSLEKKIKPRFWVLKGRNLECSLKDMLGKNDEEFAAEFIGVGRMLVPPP
ncbi:Mitochondrial transcription termination factor family protein [Quillaja saponaria]|nr:Mitochondrial transcription termination factor family protein [Quillaja saponaria]